MVQKKIQNKTQKKKEEAISKEQPAAVVKTQLPVPVATSNKTTNYPVLSFILFVVSCFLYFIVGYMFLEMAVREDFCHIRTRDKSKPTGEIVATVGDQNIYLSEIKDYAASIPQLAELPLEMIYPQLLETVVNSRVLKAAADKAGTINLPAVQQALQLAEDQIVAQAYLDQRLKALLTDERLKELYQAELKTFKPVDEVKARHILLRSEKEAEDVLIQLKAGASFEMLASKYSLDKSTPDGDLGYFAENMMIPEFGKAAFALRVGQISEPVKTAFGWHIIQVEDRRQSEPPVFEDVKDELRQMLMERDVGKVLSEERQKMNVRIKKPKL